MADRAMTEIEAKEAALSLMIRGEIAGMSADGELRLHLAPLIRRVRHQTDRATAWRQALTRGA